MKKEKLIINITIFCMCIMLSSVVFMQFKTAYQTAITDIENMNEDELKKEVISWQNKCKQVDTQLSDVNQKIQDYEKSIFNNEESFKLLQEEQSLSSKLIGKTNVEGQGVIIQLEDNENEQITASQLLSLINELKYAGAEAISVNGNRITNLTDIVDVNFVIMIDGKKIASPYEIKAIGNQTYLSSTLNSRTGLISTYKETGVSIIMQESDNVYIQKYEGEIKLKYGSK